MLLSINDFFSLFVYVAGKISFPQNLNGFWMILRGCLCVPVPFQHTIRDVFALKPVPYFSFLGVRIWLTFPSNTNKFHLYWF